MTYKTDAISLFKAHVRQRGPNSFYITLPMKFIKIENLKYGDFIEAGFIRNLGQNHFRGEDEFRHWKKSWTGYVSLHNWIHKHKPKSDRCEDCGQSELRLEAANISGEYKRDINDFKWLCRKCHLREHYIKRRIRE